MVFHPLYRLVLEILPQEAFAFTPLICNSTVPPVVISILVNRIDLNAGRLKFCSK